MKKKKFIFDENYIKRYAKKDTLKWLIIGASALVLIIVIIIIILATKDKPSKPKDPVLPVFEFKDELILEAGSILPEVVDYFDKLENVDVDAIEIQYPEEFEISYDITSLCTEEEIEEINNTDGNNIADYECAIPILKNPTSYGVTISLLEKEYTVNLIVVDTKSPLLLTKELEIYEQDPYAVSDFIDVCYDITDVCEPLFYDNDVDEAGNKIDYSAYTTPGEYTVKIIAQDKYENISEPVEAKLIVKEIQKALYTVEFNTDGGNVIESIKIEDGSVVTEPAAPTKEGYIFSGWYLNNLKYDFASPVTSNITLIAKWEKIETPVAPPKPPNGNGTGNDNPPSIIYVTTISLDFKKIYLYVNESKTVKATVMPSNAVNKTVSWSSADGSVATVNNGVITGHKAGTTIITATAGGKSAKVEVVVREKSTTPGVTCPYGDTSYNSNRYILSVNLIKNNCAVDPNLNYNEATTLAASDYKDLIQQLVEMGFDLSEENFNYYASYVKVRNNSGTGLVGYQISISLTVIDLDTKQIMNADYIIKPNGTRQFSINTIKKNNMSFN